MSAPTPEAVRALIARWRAEAAPHRGATGDEAEIAHAKASCADELEEAIARDAAGLLRPTPDWHALVQRMRAEEQRLCRMADGQGQTAYAERLAAKADGFGTCADWLDAAGSPLAGDKEKP